MDRVTLNEARHRFELPTEAGTAVLEFAERPGGVLDLYHTLVPPADRGRGAGRILVQQALDWARDHERHVIPTCPFVAAWFERHPEYRDLLAG